MKQVVAYILLVAFLLQNFSRMMILADYELRKEYIAKNLCENRNKPQMNCHGQCHLKKQLANEEKKENLPTNNIKEKQESILYCHTELAIAPVFSFTKNVFGFYAEQKIVPLGRTILHPPPVTA